MPARVHPSSVVSDGARVGDGTQIWLFCQIREDAQIGDNCILGKGVYVDSGVVIGNAVKIQNNVSIYFGVTIEDGVFVGPHVCFTNDKVPRAVNPDMSLKTSQEWTVARTRVMAGATLGANATIVCGVTVGRWAIVAAGSVVTTDVADHALVMGNPARLVGWVCACGERVEIDERQGRGTCVCGRMVTTSGQD
jgi:UDP-2-acetamido-3-amino-2,3-dideoxy-glucuronate N-acetyltransferase